MVAVNAVLALIPARGGSKSIPRKNISPLAGHPLIAYSIAAAQAARTVGRIIVSTEDVEVGEVARRYGAEVPFMRPTDLALDNTPDLPVFQHALNWLDEHEGYRPLIIVHLRPTSPLRRAEQVDRAVALLQARPDADAVRTVVPPLQNPFKMWTVGPEGFLDPLLRLDYPEPYNLPRQALPSVYWQTGYVDVTRWRTIMELGSMTGQKILPLPHDGAEMIDIDSPVSLEWAGYLIHRGRVRPPLPAGMSAKAIKLLILDFDGVLTDNRVCVDEEGRESVLVDRSDGLGLSLLRKIGVDAIVISGEQNPVVAARCRKLDLPYEQGVEDKAEALARWMAHYGVRAEETAYVGNDVNDLACMEAVGTAVAVCDAHPTILARADIVLTRAGGHGAVREICDLIIASRMGNSAQKR